MKRISQWANQHMQMALGLAIGIYTILVILGVVWGMFLEAYGYHTPIYLPLVFGGLASWLLFFKPKRKNKKGNKKSFNRRYWELRSVYFVLNICIVVLSVSVGNKILQEDSSTAFDLFLVDNNDLEWSTTDLSTSVVYGLQPIEKAKKKRERRAKRLKAKKRQAAKRLRDINGNNGQWGVFVLLGILCIIISGGMAALVCASICSGNPLFIVLSLVGFVGSIVGCVFAFIHAVRLRDRDKVAAENKPPMVREMLVLPQVLSWIGLAAIGLGVIALVVGIVFSMLFPVFAGVLVALVGLIMVLAVALQKKKVNSTKK